MAERQPKRDIRTKALACIYIARSTVHALKYQIGKEWNRTEATARSSLVPRPYFCGGEEKRQGAPSASEGQGSRKSEGALPTRPAIHFSHIRTIYKRMLHTLPIPVYRMRLRDMRAGTGTPTYVYKGSCCKTSTYA